MEKEEEPPKKLVKEKIEEYILFSFGFVTPRNDTWLFDSGASKHMIGKKNALSSFEEK